MSRFKRGKPGRFKRRNAADQDTQNTGVTRFGVEGAPGFMHAPVHCETKKVNYGSGPLVDLAICRYYCKAPCEEWEEFSKAIKRAANA